MGEGLSVLFFLGEWCMMKKKTILISFFSSNNFGDLMISGTLTQLLNIKYNLTLVDFSRIREVETNDEEVKTAVRTKKSIKQRLMSVNRYLAELLAFANLVINSPRKYKKIAHTFDEAESVILAGGNMIMDMGLFPIYTYKVYYALKLAKKKKKKTALLAIGVGPLNNQWQKRYVKKIMSLCDYISVRDEPSKLLLESISSYKGVERWYDPVLTMLPQQKIHKHTIGINIYAGANAKEEEKNLQAYVKLVAELAEKYTEYKILLFSSELNDYRDVKYVYDNIKKDNISIKDVKSVQDLKDVCRSSDVIIAARMHTLITSSIMSTPTIAFAWQQKIYGFMKIIEREHYVYDISHISDDMNRILVDIEDCLKNEAEQSEIIRKKVKEIGKDFHNKLNKFFERF